MAFFSLIPDTPAIAAMSLCENAFITASSDLKCSIRRREILSPIPGIFVNEFIVFFWLVN